MKTAWSRSRARGAAYRRSRAGAFGAAGAAPADERFGRSWLPGFSAARRCLGSARSGCCSPAACRRCLRRRARRPDRARTRARLLLRWSRFAPPAPTRSPGAAPTSWSCSGWSGSGAAVPQLMLSWSELGWWIGHALEVIGVVMVGVPVALDLHRGASRGRWRRPARRGAGRARRGLPRPAGARDDGPARHKDAYTELHTRRVALRAVQVGERLGLSAGRLR